MPFGVVTGVGRGMDVLDGDGDRRREGAVLEVKLAALWLLLSKQVSLLIF